MNVTARWLQCRHRMLLPVRAEAVVWDLDGTLVDTLADIAAGVNHGLAAAGLPTLAEDAYRSIIGEGSARLVERALPPGASDRRDAVLAAYRQYDRERNPARSRLYLGVDLLLDDLTRRGVPMAILSNKPHDSVVRVVERLLRRWPFEEIRGEQAGVPRKPDPTAALAVACALRTSPGHCLFVGDTAIDIETARRAGMVPVGAAWGLRDRAELERAGAWRVIDHPLDLLQIGRTESEGGGQAHVHRMAAFAGRA